MTMLLVQMTRVGRLHVMVFIYHYATPIVNIINYTAELIIGFVLAERGAGGLWTLQLLHLTRF